MLNTLRATADDLPTAIEFLLSLNIPQSAIAHLKIINPHAQTIAQVNLSQIPLSQPSQLLKFG
ncbi:hypothetical protein [Myxacorys almedinensis]|uniref:Uncharacterized protein n=1 Tax=Myxacorys almedinensis A TaxID=2690445 RepID=A0A8J8CJN1_9CYAN|nr:hypothetical protein [Myxacorys almedinensis]NDJ17781.1 hypothetical protein [Myxacorys almedinensis A]